MSRRYNSDNQCQSWSILQSGEREMQCWICFKITRFDPKKGLQVVAAEVLLERQVDARSDTMRVFMSLVVKTRTPDSQD